MLTSLFRRQGRGMPWTRRIIPAVLTTATVFLVLVAAPALASGPPVLGYFEASGVFATRAHLAGPIASAGSVTEWRIEYAPAESGHEPIANSPSWTLAGSGAVYSGCVVELSCPMNAELRQLKPAITYYARAIAKNNFGVAEKKAHFTTTAVTAPEFLQAQCGGEDYKFNNLPEEGSRNPSMCAEERIHQTSGDLFAEVDTNGAQTEYHFGLATLEFGPYAPVPGSSGTVTEAEDFALTKAAHLTGLSPETTYFLRAFATNAKGEATETVKFTTPPSHPEAYFQHVRNVTATSAHLTGTVEPRSSETHWRFEYAPAESGHEPVANSPSWTTGPAGVIPAVEADEEFHQIQGELTGPKHLLSPATVYYVRLFAENGHEPASTSNVRNFETAGPPTATAYAVHALHGEAIRLLGAVDPRSAPTSEEQTVTIAGAPTGGTFTLSFEEHTTAAIPFDAPAEGPGSVRNALGALPNEPDVGVIGPPGGPYTIYFGGNVKNPLAGKDVPQMTADASGLTPAGTVVLATTQQGGEGYDTHYSFEYVSEKQFKEEGEWSKAASTPEFALVLGENEGDLPKTEVVGADVPGLLSGETYHYRLRATNTSPGNPVVHGPEQTLTVPSPTVEPQPVCENERFRSGPSALLPDCRAYEQITPVNKEGADEILEGGWGGALVGEDGNHVMVADSLVKWGSGPDAGQSPYFFSRTSTGWGMTAGSPQPEAGTERYEPELFAPSLTQFGFQAGLPGSLPDAEFRAGPPGGPYVTVATVPTKQIGGVGTRHGWVAASADFSKLVLQVEDHTLLGSATGTKSGNDLYEYSKGGLRQVNVGVGSCGATIVHGSEGEYEGSRKSSPHAVSADGSRVFFEAVPGNSCSEPSHLYMRVDGVQTVDVGVYRFAAADSEGTEVLLEKRSGETRGFFLYDTESGAHTLLPGLTLHHEAELHVSEDLTAIYLISNEQLSGTEAPLISAGESEYLYRYDIPTRTLHYVVNTVDPHTTGALIITPDGRYAYFDSQGVPGIPGGGLLLGGSGPTTQLYRYDSVQDVLACVSCASSFDPEPRLSVADEGGALGVHAETVDGRLTPTYYSADGDYAFFETPAALVPSDVNGEIPPEPPFSHDPLCGQPGHELCVPEHSNVSPSNDVYEWRRDGLGGCARPQGCLSLITPGTKDGYILTLLGTTPSGDDVFFSTHQSLLPQDNDTAGDIYDARIGGGFPEPTRTVECEGDACSTPFAAPNDLTPSSSTFQGAGNLPGTTLPEVKPKPKPKPKSKCKPKPKKKCKAKTKKKTGKRAKKAGNKRRGR